MDKMLWGDRVMLLFLNGKSDGDGGSSCDGKKKISSRGVDSKCSKDGNVLPPIPSPRPVKKKISSRGVDNKHSKDGNVLPPVPSPRPVKKKINSRRVDNKRSKDGNVLPPVRSPCPVKKKINSRGVDNKRSKDGNVLPPVPSPRPCNSDSPCIMETRVYSRKKIKSTNEDCWIDQISRLPDELLVSILSCLSLKEAAASSILSRRWRFLWTFISKLDFEGSDMWTSFTSKPDLDIIGFHSKSKREASIRECWEYVGWVDDVLGLRNKSTTIEELRISFSLNEAHQSYIDRWIKFALAKKVVRLDMNLVQTCFAQPYTFPNELLCGNESNSWGFKDLRLIRMFAVSLSDGALEIFLRSCPLLEEIFIADCRGFSTVKIVNQLPALKRLTLIRSHDLESVEVRDSNLVYFMYRAILRPLKYFVLKNVPLLVEIDVGGWVTEKVDKFIAMFLSCLPQLEKLTIHRRILLSIMEADMICSSVKMSNLKQLVWKFMGFYVAIETVEGLTILVGALPSLQRLVVMSYYDKVKVSVDGFFNHKCLPYRRTYAYSHLKQVEFVGYHGKVNELAILLHFLEKAAALEEVIIHPAKDTFIDFEIGEYTEREIDAFRSIAKAQLTTWLPSSSTVTLKIL